MRPSRFLLAMFALLAVLAYAAQSGSAQTVTTLHSFNGIDGSDPQVEVLAQGRDGWLYGTAIEGGANGFGIIFKQGANGNVVLHEFTGPDGKFPGGGLTLGTDGNFYGTAAAGGTYGYGTIYKITPGGVLTVLYNFTGASDGGFPGAPPVEGTDGNYYGSTNGGMAEVLTFYRLTRSGSVTTLNTTDFSVGWDIQSALFQAADGYLYATATIGGAFDCGAILKLSTSGTLVSHYSFRCGVGGISPIATLAEDAAGNLYGTTLNGGTHEDAGTIFKIDSSLESTTVLYDFGAMPKDGYGGYAGLTLATDGFLYGATSLGGRAGAGTLFKISPSGSYTQLYSFPDLVGPNGQEPSATPAQDTNGSFYGVTQFGGAYGDGSIYNLNVGLNPFVAFVQPTGAVGGTAQILGQGLTGTTSVTFNGVASTSIKIVNDTYITAAVPTGATTGKVVVTTPGGALTSNVNFRILQ